MAINEVTGQKAKTVYDFENEDFSKKNEKEVVNSIIELAKAAETDFKKMEQSVTEENGHLVKIDGNERVEIAMYWLPIIGKAIKSIPANLRNACSGAIDRLKQTLTTIAKGVSINSTTSHLQGGDIEINIDKDGNSTVTLPESNGQNNSSGQTSYRPTTTDAEADKPSETVRKANEFYEKVKEANDEHIGNVYDNEYDPYVAKYGEVGFNYNKNVDPAKLNVYNGLDKLYKQVLVPKE